MQAQQTETGSISRKVSFTLTPEEFAPHRESRLRDVRSKAKVKGYRPGTVPMNLIRKLYGKSIDQEAGEEAIQKAFGEWAEENDAKPFGTPQVTELEIDDDGGLTFTVEYQVLPEFELGEWKGMKGRKIFHVVTDEEIDKEIEWHRDRQRKEENVDVIADENHTAVVDFQKLDESGTPLIGEVSKDIPVDMRSEQINPDLKEKLLGLKLDESARITLPVGENDEEIPYQVTVKEIKQVIMPEVDEEFAQKITGEEEADVEDLRDMIKQSIEAEYEGRYSQFFRNELIDALIDAHEFDVPDALVGQVLQGYLDDEKKRFKDDKLPEDFPLAQFIEERSEQAQRVAKWLMLRDRLVEEESISVTEEDVEQLAAVDAARMGVETSMLLSYYKDREEVEQRILAEKVIALLADYADVEEEIEDLEWQKRLEAEEEKAAEESESSVEGDEETEVEAAAETDESSDDEDGDEAEAEETEPVASEAQETEEK